MRQFKAVYRYVAGGQPKLKTIPGKRYTPTHPELERYGLYIENQDEDGKWRLREEMSGQSLISADRPEDLEPALIAYIESHVGWEQAHEKISSHPPAEQFVNGFTHNHLSRLRSWKRLNELVGYTVPVDGIVSAATGSLSIDIIRWDKRVNPPEGTSLAQEIENRYGKEARELAEALI